ncbi:MAG: pyruvate, water dikinase, partial [Thermodesulfobacteriota bacterium]
RVLSRISAQGVQPRSGPLYDLVTSLTLTDPDDSSFKARNCRSLHDCLRFMHEMAVRTLFRFGDEQNTWISRKAPKLITKLPVSFHLIGLDDCLPSDASKVRPEAIESIPFQALWRGMSDARLPWPNRWQKAMRGMPKDFREAVLGGTRGPRRSGAANYALLARDYLNLNARFAYHYALVDAMIGPGSENNHVHFRLRGGGGSGISRHRRTRFLELVLRDAGFGVDRRGDLITAWLRRYPNEDSVAAMELLGRLIVCARQLDAVLLADSDARRYAEYFREQKFGHFA